MLIHFIEPVWAARRGASGEEVVFTVIFVAIVSFIAILSRLREGSARYDLLIRNGLPYCPHCNRQVSYRRDYCRACGHHFKTYGPSPSELASAARERALAEIDEISREKVAQERAAVRAAEREARRQQRHVERQKYYRNRGVEPGPWAWYKILPDWVQAVLMGLAISAPILIGAVVFAKSR
jgi:hypothetical protein